MRVVRQLIYIGDRKSVLHGLRHRGVKISRQTGHGEVIYERILEVSDEDGVAPDLTSDELDRVKQIEEG